MAGPATIFDHFVALGVATTSLPRESWLSDPVDATQYFLDNMMPAAARLPHGLQRPLSVQIMSAGSWAASGFPTFDLTHRLAATLMATRVDPEIEREVVSPFPGVVVKLPDNLLYIEDGKGNLSSATVLAWASYLKKGRPTISYIVEAQAGVSVFGINLPQEGFVSQYTALDQGESVATDVDARTSEMARKLIIGLCLYLSDASKLGQPRELRKKPSKGAQRPPGVIPTVNQYVLGREIQLDSNVVKGIREYVKHGHKAPAVQYMVEGHWKMQAYGPGRSLRKAIQIAPYWRGPIDAPILTHGPSGEGTEGFDEPEVPAWMRHMMPGNGR